MGKLSIDGEELIGALEYHGEGEWFLDLQTGEVVFVAGEGYSEPDDELEAQIETEPERFHSIEPIQSSTGWQVMADFVAQLPSGEARSKLTNALQRSQPFRRFKDELTAFPVLRESYFAHHAKALEQLARDWLDEEDIDAELRFRAGEE